MEDSASRPALNGFTIKVIAMLLVIGASHTHPVCLRTKKGCRIQTPLPPPARVPASSMASPPSSATLGPPGGSSGPSWQQ
ncbi:hypothetical protein C0J52_23315 [Blattella germanica]|nr:hypothetical protein C0J52_23315 [Blattella germanica]